MDLYVFAGECNVGKTSLVRALKTHFEEEGKKVCSFQRSKNYADLGRQWGHHYIIPPVAFQNMDELEQWIPAGFDVGIFELASYAFLGNGGYTSTYLSLLPDSTINEVITPDSEMPNRETNLVYSKVGVPVENACSFTTDFSVHGIEHLKSISINGEYEPPKYEYKVLVAGYVPPEYLRLFPNAVFTTEARFFAEVSEYDLGIVGYSSKFIGTSQLLPDDAKIFSLFPPAFYPDAIEYSHGQIAKAIADSDYGDIWYKKYKNVPQVEMTDTRLIINGVPPSRFVVNIGWF